jgi:dihydroorotase
MGMLGLETAFSIAMATMNVPGLLTWRDLAQRMSVRPALIGRVRTQGHDLAVGAVANIAVVDPSATRTISATDLASKSRNTPYAGLQLPGRVVHTLYAGTPTVLDGALA